MIRTYFQMLIEEELPDAVGKMKQFASWFTHGVPGGAALRKAIYESKSAPEILGRVEEFFESRLQLCGAGILESVSQLRMSGKSGMASQELAAKRRQNAAHGASRGSIVEND